MPLLARRVTAFVAVLLITSTTANRPSSAEDGSVAASPPGSAMFEPRPQSAQAATTEPAGAGTATEPDATSSDAAAPTAATPDSQPASTDSPPAAPEPTRAEIAPPPPKSIAVASPGGAYGAALEIAVIAPFRASRAFEVETVAPNRADAADVVELDAAELARQCAGGELMPIDTARLLPAPDGTAASEDYLSGGLERCGAATFAWSSVFAVRPDAFKKGAPRTIADVFNTARYPGVRVLPSGPRYVLEAALLADGVAASEVYAQLGTEEGVDRALKKLASLGDSLAWAESPSEAMKLLASGKAAIASTFSGRVFLDIARGAALEVIWPGQIYDVAYLAIRRRAAADLAMDYVAFATAPQQLARLASHIPYGPMRRSAVALVANHATLGIPLAAHLPTAPGNFEASLRLDREWWAANEQRLAARLAEWREGSKRAARAE